MAKVFSKLFSLLFLLSSFSAVAQKNSNREDLFNSYNPYLILLKGDSQELHNALKKLGDDVNFLLQLIIASPFRESVNETLYALERILDEGANVNTKLPRGDSILHTAIITFQKEAALFLIEKGANVNITNINKQTPLHLASQFGFKDIAEALLDKGAKINVFDKSLQTPLKKAIYPPKLDMIHLLLERGAYTHLESKNASHPLRILMKHYIMNTVAQDRIDRINSKKNTLPKTKNHNEELKKQELLKAMKVLLDHEVNNSSCKNSFNNKLLPGPSSK